MKFNAFTIALPLLSSLFFACGESSDSDDDSSIKNSALIGTYKLTSYLQASGDCEVAGEPEESEIDSLMIITTQSFMGQTNLVAVSCSSPANCDEIKAIILKGNGFYSYRYFFSFDSGSDADGFTGTTENSGFSRDGMCEEAGYDKDRLTDLGNNSVEAERRTYIAPDFKADSEGVCWTDEGAKNAKGQPCSEKITLRATRLSASL